MIRAKTPGAGHPLVVIVLGERIADQSVTAVACSGCGAQYTIRCSQALAVNIMDGISDPWLLREHLTAKAMMSTEDPVDQHLYEDVWTMIDFFDEFPCDADGEVWRRPANGESTDAPLPA